MIEFQYFDGCPNSELTLSNLIKLADSKEISIDDIKIVKIENAEDAKKLNFQGSPTILVDGVEIYSEKRPTSFSYGCRVYNIEGKQTGVLDTEYIRTKIRKLRANSIR